MTDYIYNIKDKFEPAMYCMFITLNEIYCRVDGP